MGDSIKKVEDIKVNDAKVEKSKKVSVTYTLKRFKDTIKTLHENAFITQDEARTLGEVYNNMLKREIGQELKF